MNDRDRIAGRKRAEMMEWVLKVVSSFLRVLKAVICIYEFHTISLTERHVARENHFSHVLSSG